MKYVSTVRAYQKSGTQDPQLCWNPRHEAKDPYYGWDPGPGTENPKSGIHDPRPRNQLKGGIQDPRPKTLIVGLETQDTYFTWNLRSEIQDTERGIYDTHDKWDSRSNTNISSQIWDARTMI